MIRAFLLAGMVGFLAAPGAMAQGPDLKAVRIERMAPGFDALIAPGATIEELARGFSWSEGPTWRKEGNGGYLLFSDVPKNTIYRFDATKGLTIWLRPSGYIGTNPPGRELGSNGLTTDLHGALVMADHGDRLVARVNGSNFTRVTLADRYQGKRFNSPNDLAFRANGDLYFTDPPYGLKGLDADPAKEQPVNGVYRVAANGEVTLLTGELSFPNGIAFSPDEKTLYVSNADGRRPVWMAYPVLPDGLIGPGRVLFDASAMIAAGYRGVPDGLRVDRQGNLFAAGPGGIFVISAAGKQLGMIFTGQPTANCAFGEDGSTLYITANDRLLRVRLRSRGIGF